MQESVIESGTACGTALMNWLRGSEETALFHFVDYGKRETVLFTRLPDQMANRPNVETILYTKLTDSKFNMESQMLGVYDRQSGFLVIGFFLRVWLPFGFDWALITNPKIVAFSDLQKEIQKLAAKKLFSLCQKKYPNRKSLPSCKVLGISQSDMDVAWLKGRLHTDFVKASLKYLPRYKTDDWYAPLYINYLRGDIEYTLSAFGGDDFFDKPDKDLDSRLVTIRSSILKAAVQGYHWLEKVKKYTPSKKALKAKLMYHSISNKKAPLPWKVDFHVNGRPATLSVSEGMQIRPTSFYYGFTFSDIYDPVYSDTHEPCDVEDCVSIGLEQVDTIFDAKGDVLYEKEE